MELGRFWNERIRENVLLSACFRCNDTPKSAKTKILLPGIGYAPITMLCNRTGWPCGIFIYTDADAVLI
jgi:hypothetical protein